MLLVFAPVVLAQDDNPNGDDLGRDNRGFDDNVVVSPTASATLTMTATLTANATATSTATATVATQDQYGSAPGLPATGGAWPGSASLIALGAVLAAGRLVTRFARAADPEQIRQAAEGDRRVRGGERHD